ncbi:Beta-galactosidase [uncultured Paludibacter sp.]|uniref:Beta-galactosidase n=1 Tax=uncultured Paludibacter sp. TaxID=497635 RepID=A0A653AK09_9BACT|nr:Beta-galactosidase [uncultured Paludibacter sp.]
MRYFKYITLFIIFSLPKIYGKNIEFVVSNQCIGDYIAQNSDNKRTSVDVINTPSLTKTNDTYQLSVNGKPFLMLGGELGNSSVVDVDEMKWIWEKLRGMNLNTVLAPVYWELIEPQEGKFDFSLVDAMINQAREKELHLVFLWFGTWKNSMSCYVPEWIKKDFKRFPRTLDKNGKPSEILSAFSENVLNADIKAFTELMKHIKLVDAEKQTVIMMQVENEIGQLPEARDYSSLANKAFQQEVPEKLMDYLSKNKDILLPHIKELWASNGYKQKGNWETVFGKSVAADEVFTAWYYAIFADKVAEAGKNIYNLPMYVNCALNRPKVEPGKYPSGGPLPHLLNVWQAAASHIDMLSPDVYHGDFRNWLAQYDKLNNPVFLPEIRMEPENAAQVFYAIGKHKSLGFSPFSIENANDTEATSLRKSYKVLDDLTELLFANRATSDGVYLDKTNPSDTINLGDYQMIISHVMTLPWTDGAKAEKWTSAGCVIIETVPDEFWIGGTSVTCTFRNIKDKNSTTGILSADIAVKKDNKWKFIRLNGDQTHQGRHIRIGSGEWQIQRIKLYNYK